MKEILMISDDLSVGPITTFSNATMTSEFIIDGSRESMNRILSQVNLSPIRSRTRKRLDKHSDSSRRRITSKLIHAMRVIQSRFLSTAILLGLHVNV